MQPQTVRSPYKCRRHYPVTLKFKMMKSTLTTFLTLAVLATVLLASCGTEQTGQTYNVIEVCDNDGCRAVNYNMQLNRATADTI